MKERRGWAAENGRARLSRFLAGGLLALLLLIAFRGALSGRLFYLRDISQNHQPTRHLITERMRAGELPLWDPYHGGGTPLLANPNNLVLHPISALFLVLPLESGFTTSIVLQFVLLAWGGYLLVRALGVGRSGAALAACVMALSGPAASLASMQNIISGVAWVPLGLWAWVRGLERGRRGYLAIAAVCVAVVLIAAEIASLSAFIVMASVLGMTRGVEGPTGADRKRVLGCLLLVLILAALIGAAQILPARELLPLTSRGPGFSEADGMKWSLEPTRLLELVMPRLFGDPTRLSPEGWWGGWLFEGRYPFLLCLYVGAIPCLLAMFALGWRGPGEGRIRWLGAAAALFLLLALGIHSAFYSTLFRWLPPVRQVRYPERFVVAAILVVAILAAFGLERLLRADQPSRGLRAGILTATAISFLMATMIVSSPRLSDRLLIGIASVPASFLESDSGAVLRGGLLESALWMFAETAILLTAALALGRSRRFGGSVGYAIVAASGLSMIWASAPALSAADPGWLHSPSPLAGVVGQGPGSPRVHHHPRPEGLSIWAKTDELIWGYRFDRFTYSLATGHSEGVPTILDAATDRMDLSPSAALGQALAELSLDDRLKVLASCRAGFLLSYQPIDHPALEPGPVLNGLSLPPLRVYRLFSIVPRVRFVSRARRMAFPGDLARSLAEPGYDPTREVLLEEVSSRPPAKAASGEGRVTIVEEAPERIEFSVEAPASGYLVLVDAHAPGWSATVDGAPAEIQRADGLFRAVRVPAGRHDVVMSYRPRSVTLGLSLSILGVVSAFCWGVWSLRGAR